MRIPNPNDKEPPLNGDPRELLVLGRTAHEDMKETMEGDEVDLLHLISHCMAMVTAYNAWLRHFGVTMEPDGSADLNQGTLEAMAKKLANGLQGEKE